MKRQSLPEWDQLSSEMRPKIRFWVPAAAMDAADLRQEIIHLKERGFGGVEVVVLSTIPEDIMKGEDGWGTGHWNGMVRVIADTTQELGMSMDLANGPMWPISMPTVQSADDPAALCELTYGVLECSEDGYYTGPLPERRTVHEEGTPRLIHVLAYLETEDKVLRQDSYRDLMENVVSAGDRTTLECRLPRAAEGTRWLIFAFYSQPSVHKTGMDQYYVIDHLSEAGAEACKKYWEPILSRCDYPSMESLFCDSLEYRVMMEWTPKLPEEFEKRRGYSILPYLPFVGKKVLFPASDVPGYRMEVREISDMINRDYYETLTQCYCEYHLAMLEEMASKYGKSIRYQVAYNKPFEGERCPLYVQIPENEALGRPALDYQKMMASAAHLGRKKRYSFECAAEFGNAYGQTYEDLMWWVKRSLMAGMNAQVLHGASYSGGYYGTYSVEGNIAGVNWPGYEGFGKAISNYWNRTLSVEDARNCVDTIARMNAIFRKKAKVDCAIYRQSYENEGLGSEFCFYPDGGALANSGYSYETISPFLLELPVCKVENGILDKDGVGYKCLIVPEQQHISTGFLKRVAILLEQGFPVIWIGEAPKWAEYFNEWQQKESREKWSGLLDQVWTSHKLKHVRSMDQVVETLKKIGIMPDIQLDSSMDIYTAEHVDEEKEVRYYALYAYNRIQCTPDEPNDEEFACSAAYKKGTTKSTYQRPGAGSRRIIPVILKGSGSVWQCNPWNGKLTRLSFTANAGYTCGKIEIEEDEMVILALFEQEDSEENVSASSAAYYTAQEKKELVKIPVQFHSLELTAFVPDSKNEKSFLRSHFSDEKRYLPLGELKPWRTLDASLKKFAGKGVYSGSMILEKKKTGKKYILNLGNVSDTFHVCVNGEKTEFPDQVLKKVDITEQLAEGENQITIEVVSNLYNCLQKGGQDSRTPFVIPYVEKDYGIWEKDGEVCAVYEI